MKFLFLALLIMFFENSKAQVLCGDIQELKKHEGETFYFFGKICPDYDLPYCPAILLLNDNSKIFIGRTKLFANYTPNEFIIIKGIIRATNPTFEYSSYKKQSGYMNYLPGRVDKPDSIIKTMPFFEQIDSIIPVGRIIEIENNDKENYSRVMCVGKIQNGNVFHLVGDGKKIILSKFVRYQQTNGNKEEFVGLFGNLVNSEGTDSLLNIQCVWNFPVCRNASDFERLASREVVIEGQLKWKTFKLGGKTTLPILILKDRTNVYIEQGKDIVSKKSGNLKLLTTISFTSPKSFYLPSEIWNPGIFHVADYVTCIIYKGF